MNDNAICCETCSRSCGTSEHLYCSITAEKMNISECCMMYETKEEGKDENSDTDE